MLGLKLPTDPRWANLAEKTLEEILTDHAFCEQKAASTMISLIAALIEARSCERFRLLSTGLEDAELRKFYHEFMVSEAGHYRLFIDLAKKYLGPEKAKKRWEEWLEYEAGIMKSLEIRGDRIH